MIARLAAGALAILLWVPASIADDGLPAPFYSAKPINSTVVDHVSGQPIEGAVVVARWEARPLSGQGPRLQVSEAVTKADGRFRIPGWGPRARPPLTQLQDRSPQLVVFKHGYVPVMLRNAPKERFAYFRAMTDLPAREVSLRMPYEGNPGSPLQESVWDGTVIRLEPFTGNEMSWLWYLDVLVGPLGDDAGRCPQMFETLRAERKYFTSVPRDHAARVDGFFIELEHHIENARRRR